MPTDILLYTGASYSAITDRGGWAACIVHEESGSHLELHGGCIHTNKQRMDLMAVLCGIRELTRPCHVTLCSDIAYICDAFTKGWITNWAKNGWVKKDKKTVKHVDLWQQIFEHMQSHTIDARHLPKTAKNAEHALCLKLAMQETQNTDLPTDPGQATDGASMKVPEDTSGATTPAFILYTDGSCLGNHGPGGWAAIVLDHHGNTLRELSGGFQCTTNNRMEILSVIKGLEAIPEPAHVECYTDSQYVCNALSKGWLQSWIKNRWMRGRGQKVKNVDLWQNLMPLLAKHTIHMHWVRGHNGNAENERCDELAREVAHRKGLPPDEGLQTDDL